jgi:hypothetical protein
MPMPTNGAPGLFLNGRKAYDGQAQPDSWSPILRTPAPSYSPEMGPPASAMMPPAQSNLMPIDQPKAPKGSGSGAIPIVDRSDYEDLVKRLNDKGVNSFGEQQKGLDHLRDQIGLALANSNAGLDLSALASLTDAWTGSHLAHDYARPDYDKQNQTIYGLEQALQRGRNDLSENELGLLKSQLGFEGERIAAKERAAAQGEARRQHEENLADSAANRKWQQDQSSRQSLLGTDQSKQISGINQFQSALNNYESLVRKHGLSPVGDKAAELNSAYSKLQTAYKEAEKLGALSGPDLEILDKAIRDGGGIKNWILGQSKGAEDGIYKAANQMREAGKRDFERSHATLKAAYPRGADDILNDYKTRFDSIYSQGAAMGVPAQTSPSANHGASDLHSMSDAELDSELARLRGGK